MNLKSYNPDNCQSSRGGRSTKPTITINSKTGLFRLTPSVCDLLEVKEGDSVVFHQEEQEEENWYIEKEKGGFVLRSKDTIGKGLFFNSTTLARNIFSSVAYEGTNGRVLVAGQPTKIEKRKLFCLLTVGLKNA